MAVQSRYAVFSVKNSSQTDRQGAASTSGIGGGFGIKQGLDLGGISLENGLLGQLFLPVPGRVISLRAARSLLSSSVTVSGVCSCLLFSLDIALKNRYVWACARVE